MKYIHIILLLSLCCSTTRENFTEKKWAMEVESAKTADLYAPHYRDGEYFNPWLPMKNKSVMELLYWRLSGKADYRESDKSRLPVVIPNALERIKAIPGRDFILWVGHNTFLMRINGEYWVTDPVFTEKIIILGRKTPPGITIKEISTLTDSPNIMVSHNHYDHLSEESIREMPAGSRIYAPLGLKDFLTGLGKKNVTEMDWWQEIDLGAGKKLLCLPAQHWSRRIGQDYNTTLWAGFMLITPAATIFFGGDSGYFTGYREIGKRVPRIDYAILPVSASHPRWFMHYAHMDPGEAIRAFTDLGAGHFIPAHWGTFHLGDEPPGYAGPDLVKKIEEGGMDRKKFLIMGIGEIVLIDGGKR